MNALIINCSPVRGGATAEIVRLVMKSLCKQFKDGISLMRPVTRNFHIWPERKCCLRAARFSRARFAL